MKRSAVFFVAGGLSLFVACTRGNPMPGDAAAGVDSQVVVDGRVVADTKPTGDKTVAEDGKVAADNGATTPDSKTAPDLGNIPSVDGQVTSSGISPTGPCTYKVWVTSGKKSVRYCVKGKLNVNSFVFTNHYGKCKLAVPKKVTTLVLTSGAVCLVAEVTNSNIQAYDSAKPACTKASSYTLAVPVDLVSTAKGVYVGKGWLSLGSCQGESGTKTTPHGTPSSPWIALF